MSRRHFTIPLILALPLSAATVDFSDIKISPNKGKPGQTFPVALTSANCKNQTTPPTQSLQDAKPTPTGGDIELNFAKGTNPCLVEGTLKIHADASPGDVQVIITPKESASFLITFTIQDPNIGPIPPGLKPTVDVQWDVLDHSITRDNFGARIADNFYAIQIVIGNDSGYALQLSSIGFIPRSVSALAFMQQVLPNSSYVIARGVLEEGQLVSARNTADRYLAGTAILVASLTPFFKNVGHRATYASAVAVFANPLLQTFEKILPDKTITELKRLDDFTLRDGVVIANNTHVRTIVFFQKYLVKGMVQATEHQLSRGLQSDAQGVQSLRTTLKELKNSVSGDHELANDVQTAIDELQNIESNGKGTSNQRQALDHLQAHVEDIVQRVAGKATLRSNTIGLDLQIANLRLLRALGADPKKSDQQLEPLIIRRELNRLVIVGDEIQYLNRVRIDSAAPAVGVVPPLLIDSVDPKQISPGVTTSVKIMGEHLAGATITPRDTTGNIMIDKVTIDTNGKFVSFSLTISASYSDNNVELFVTTPGIGPAGSVVIAVTDVPLVLSVKPNSLPKSGGDVTVSGKKLTGVRAYLDNKPLKSTVAEDGNSMTVTVPSQTADEVTLTFKTADDKPVQTSQKLTLTAH